MQDKRVALITGASGGIGQACAKELSQAGYQVVVHYRSGKSKAEELCQQLTGQALALKADLTIESECQELVKVTKKEFGRIDVLVNNAGINTDQVITFAKPDDFDKIIAINLKSVFLLSKLCSKVMIRQKFGRIINMSSIVGYTGNGGQSMYGATKGAITAFTKSIAVDLAPFQITANCIAPGFVATEMTDQLPEDVKKSILSSIPLGRMGTPEEIAGGVAFLASEKASYITGSTLHINGGMYKT